jgi:hypothetical protein
MCVLSIIEEALVEHRHREYTRENNRWVGTGVGLVSGTLMTYLRSKAKQRGLIFEVTAQELWDLFEFQEHKCALSGVPITLTTEINEQSNINREKVTASLDRVDNSKGYTIDNVQWVHKTINAMRRQYSIKEYLDWCELVYKNTRGQDNNNYSM